MVFREARSKQIVQQIKKEKTEQQRKNRATKTENRMKLISKATKDLFDPISVNEQDRMAITYKDESTFKVELYSVRPYSDQKYPPISWAGIRFLSDRLPESKKLAGRHNQYTYEISASDNNIEIINEAWKEHKNQIVFDALSQLKFKEILSLGVLQDKNAEIIARFRERGQIPITGIREHEKFPLKDHQKVGRYCLLRNPGFFLYGDPGTGKTAPTISMICEEARIKARNGEGIYRAIIVCPNSVRFNWENEFRKFATVKGRVTILRGNRLDREKLILQSLVEKKDSENLFSVVICSYDSLSSTTEAVCLENIMGQKVNDDLYWDVAVCDESHFIKTPRARRTQASFRLRDKSLKRVILTGTPLTNNLFDLWSQFEFLGSGYSGFTTFKGFRDFYGNYRLDEFTGRTELTDFKNLPLLQERLARLSYRMTKELDLPNLPEKVYDTIEVEMTSEQRKWYAKIATQINIEIEEEIERDAAEGRAQQMTVNNILVKMLRLSQVTSGFIKTDDERDFEGNLVKEGKIIYLIPNPKVEKLVEELKAKGPNDKTIVWSIDVPAIEYISRRLKIENIDHVTFYGKTKEEARQEAIDRYNTDANCRVFVGNPLAGGIGLNLLGYDPNAPDEHTTNTTHIIHYSQGWRPDVRQQADDRAHRYGTRTHVRISNLVIPNTIDEEIRERVEDKQEAARDLSEIRGILQRILNAKLNVNGDS